MTSENLFYPSSTEIKSLDTNIGFLSNSIRLFLEQIINNKGCEKKIGQAIIQAAMPRSVIAPFKIGLAVQIHNHFGSAEKKYFADDLLKGRANVFLQPSSHTDIEVFGEQIIVCFYNGDVNTGINDLKYQKCMQKVHLSNTCVKIQTLPPTKTTAKYHSYRTVPTLWSGVGLCKKRDLFQNNVTFQQLRRGCLRK